MKLSEKIRTLRTQIGINQDELAQKTGVGKRTISFYETNKALPSMDIIKRLSEIFGVTTDFLIYEDDSRGGIIQDRELMKYMLIIDKMPSEDQRHVKRFLRSFILDARLQSEPVGAELLPTVKEENVLPLRKRGRPGQMKRAVGQG